MPRAARAAKGAPGARPRQGRDDVRTAFATPPSPAPSAPASSRGREQSVRRCILADAFTGTLAFGLTFARGSGGAGGGCALAPRPELLALAHARRRTRTREKTRILPGAAFKRRSGPGRRRPALLAVATPPIRRPASADSSPRSIPVRKNPSVYCIPVPVVREVWRRSAKSRPSLSTPIACPIARCRCRSRRRHRTVLIAALIAAAAPAGGCQGGAGRGGRRERQSAAWCARWSTELPLRSLPAGGRNML